MARSRDRRGGQLSIELPPALLAAIKAEALRQERPIGAVVRRWLEMGLEGTTAPVDSAAAGGAASEELLQRVIALEAAVAQLQAKGAGKQRPAPPAPVEPPPEVLAAAAEPVIVPAAARAEETAAHHAAVNSIVPAAAGAEGITTAELAAATGTNRAGWNNWAAAEKVGTVRQHPQAGPWRLVGKAPADGGGPARWLWEQA